MSLSHPSWQAPHHASIPATKRKSEPSYLRFGNESQAHYELPLDENKAYVLLACPNTLRGKDHTGFDGALQQLRLKLLAVIEQLPKYKDQAHIVPDLRVYQPGTYADYSSGNLEVKGSKSQDHYQLVLNYGSHHFEGQFQSGQRNTRTTQRAVSRFLIGIQEQLRETVLRGNDRESTLPRVPEMVTA